MLVAIGSAASVGRARARADGVLVGREREDEHRALDATVDPRRPASARVTTQVGGRGHLQDITPAALIDLIVTEAGPLEPPFDAAIVRLLDTARD